MPQVLVTQPIAGLERRTYAAGVVVTFPDSAVIAWLKGRFQVDDTPAVVAAAIGGGAKQLVHVPGVSSSPRTVQTEVDADSGLRTLSLDTLAAAQVAHPDLVRARSRMKKKLAELTITATILATSIARIFTGYDSWGAGAAATGDNGFTQQLASEFTQFQFSNYSYPGRPVGAYSFAPLRSGVNVAATVLGIQPFPTDVWLGIPGLNDLRGVSTNGTNASACGSSPASRQTFVSRLQASATRVMIPEQFRVRMHKLDNSGANPAVTFTGAWNHAGINGNTNASISAAPGNTATMQVPAGDLIIIRALTSYQATGTFTVEVDGVTYGPFSSKGAYDSWVTDCVMLRVPNTAHTVKLTHLTGDNFVPDSVDCVDTRTDFGGFYLYSAPAPLSPAGWAIPPYLNSGRANSRATYAGTNQARVDGDVLTLTGGAGSTFTGHFSVGQVFRAQAGAGVLQADTVINEVITQTGVNGEGSYKLSAAATTDGLLTALTAVNPVAELQYENAGRDRFATWVEQAMDQLYRLGFNVVNTRATADWMITAFETPGNEVHPNDIGHAFLRQKFRWFLAYLFGLELST